MTDLEAAVLRGVRGGFDAEAAHEAGLGIWTVRRMLVAMWWRGLVAPYLGGELPPMLMWDITELGTDALAAYDSDRPTPVPAQAPRT